MLGGVLSLEAGYHDSRHDRSGRNAAVENSSVRLLTGYQREIVPDLTLSGQYSVQVMEDHAEYVGSRGAGMPRRSDYGQFEANSNLYTVVRYAF